MLIYLDYETHSEADLKSVGAYRYSEHPSTDIICVAYATDDNHVQAVSLLNYDHPEPHGIMKFIFADPSAQFVAHNALFEYAITANVLVKKYGFPASMLDPDRWICTAALSACHGLPRHLEAMAEYINKAHKKLADGKRLINTYSKPVKDRKTGALSFRPIPADDMEKFLEYNILDVEATREAYKTLIKLPNAERERQNFLHDFKMNINGVRIDRDGLNKVLDVFEKATARAELTQGMYGLNVRSVKQLQAYFATRGVNLPDAKIETVERLYDELTDPELCDILALRMFLGKASVKKYNALRERLSDDDILRYFMRYFGAHTGRLSGEGVQLHNLPKASTSANADEIERLLSSISLEMGYAELIDTAKKILPGLILPPVGADFIMGDFAAIEARGVAYLAGCDSIIKQFQNNEDIYMTMARHINPGNPQRKLGKTVILGCGYGMGVEKFKETCAKQGLDIDYKTAETAVLSYRGVYSEIKSFWYEVERAFRECWTGKRTTKAGKYITMDRGSNFVKVILPNGRNLLYHQVKIDAYTNELSYFNFGKAGNRIRIWGGVLVENITQAMCRDIMMDRVHALESAGLPVAFTVHDELVSVIVEPCKKADFDRILNTAPDWLPNFPLKTESEISRRYHK